MSVRLTSYQLCWGDVGNGGGCEWGWVMQEISVHSHPFCSELETAIKSCLFKKSVGRFSRVRNNQLVLDSVAFE